jgi:hypothetical protein
MTDIMGYRSDGGALGQDQSVTPQVQNILSSKKPLLAAPGTVIENNLYYDVTTCTVSPVEQQATFAKDRIVNSNMTMGAAPSTYLPSQLFAGNVYWVGELPEATYSETASAATADHHFYAPQGWGFAALQSVIVYMGSSNIAQIEIDWYSNLMVALAACETAGKRAEMIKRAGPLMDNFVNGTAIRRIVNTNQNGKVFLSSKNASFVRDGQESGNGYHLGDLTCCVPIRLPFTSMAVLEKKLSMDTKLLTQPIQITLATKNIENFLSVGSKINMDRAWKNSTIQIWQEELSDKSLSVRNELLSKPQFNVGYPFQYMQSLPIPFPAGDAGSSNITYSGSSYNAEQITMNLTAGATTNLEMSQFCPLFGEEISNINLTLNGQRLFAFDQGIYDGVILSKQLDKTHFDLPLSYYASDGSNDVYHSGLNQTAAKVKDFTYGFETSRYYELNFSRLRAIVAEAHMQNTPRFTSQTFQLRFNVERGNNYCYRSTDIPPVANLKTAIKTDMQVRMCYMYNGVFLIGGDGGTTKLITS